MNRLISAIVNHDAEQRKVMTLVATLAGSRRSSFRILDVGCGYGRNLSVLRQLGYDALGVEANPDIVKANRDMGLVCTSPEELQQDEQQYDLLLMSHIIEHFGPAELVGFMDMYLDRLRTGGHLIICTPLLSPYFYDDFDHVKPYHPTGIATVFGSKSAQVQYYARNRLELRDLWFRRGYFRWSQNRAKHLGRPWAGAVRLAEVLSASVWILTGSLVGRKDGWVGVYLKTSQVLG